MENIYKTSDFNLAAYLCSKGLEYRHIEPGKSGTERVSFVFFVPSHINLVQVLQEWNSPEADFLKTLMYKSKYLKSEIKRYFNSDKE